MSGMEKMLPFKLNPVAGKALVFIAIGLVVTACRKPDEAPIIDADKASMSYSKCCDNIRQKMVPMSLDERFNAEFRTLATISNIAFEVALKRAYDLCEEVSNLSDKQHALRLYDQFLDTVISLNVTEMCFPTRFDRCFRLFALARVVFCHARSMRKDSSRDLDRIFCVLGKYTDVIRAEENALKKDYFRYFRPNVDSQYSMDEFKGCIEWRDRKNWLHKFMVRLKEEVQDFRECTFSALSEGLSEEQKADAMRRLDEIQKMCMETSLDFSYFKKTRIDTNDTTNVVGTATIGNSN